MLFMEIRTNFIVLPSIPGEQLPDSPVLSDSPQTPVNDSQYTRRLPRVGGTFVSQ